MSVLFDPVKIQGMELKNRFVRSATHDGLSTETGEVTEGTVKMYSKLAQGGTGLIISGFAYVHPSGQSFLRQTAIASDDQIVGLSRLTREVHRYDAKICLQIAHGGLNSRAFRKRGGVPWTPSFEESRAAKESHRAMTAEEVATVVDAFGHAARRSREAGFDAVQLHGAHSYLFSQFLSPCSNKRTDRWGGDLEGRMEFHLRVVETITKAIGRDYPLLIKLGVQDTVPGGMNLAEGCRVARKLAEAGIDAIEVSEGLEESGANHIRKDIPSREKEAYYAEWARQVKDSVDVPVILVGGLRSYQVVEDIVREGGADLVSLCRPFIREPDLVKRWRETDQEPARCISCNLCLRKIVHEDPLECVQEKQKKGKEIKI